MSVIHSILHEAALRLTRIHPDQGYRFEVCEVVLPQQLGEEPTPEHLQIIVVADGDNIVRESELDRPGNPPAIAYRLPIVFECVLIPSKFHNEETWDQMATIVHEDMVRSVTEWPDWHQFGGICINAEIGDQQINKPEDDGGIGSVKFTIDAIYRVSETNPSKVRG